MNAIGQNDKAGKCLTLKEDDATIMRIAMRINKTVWRFFLSSFFMEFLWSDVSSVENHGGKS